MGRVRRKIMKKNTVDGFFEYTFSFFSGIILQHSSDGFMPTLVKLHLINLCCMKWDGARN